MLGAWIAERGLHCTLNIGHFEAHGHDEAAAWGLLLADVVRHVANALAEERGLTQEHTVAAILKAIDKELDAPTSQARGAFHPGHS